MIIKIVLGTMAFFSYFGGNNAPKFLKDNKEIILVIFVIILLHNIMVVEGLGPGTTCNQCIKDVDCLAKNSTIYSAKTIVSNGRNNLVQGIKYSVGGLRGGLGGEHSVKCVPDSIYRDADGNERTDFSEYPCDLTDPIGADEKAIQNYIAQGDIPDDVTCPNKRLAMSSFI